MAETSGQTTVIRVEKKRKREIGLEIQPLAIVIESN